ncbi:MAG: hypothetical protein ACXVPD_13925, partial [Bacteroidia bacterium]
FSQWNSLSPEEKEKKINAGFEQKIAGLKLLEDKEPPSAVKTLSTVLEAATPMPLPSLETMWPIIVNGELGYYQYLRNLSNKYVKPEDVVNTGEGKKAAAGPPAKKNPAVPPGMVENPDYKKGGYAALLDNQVANLTSPSFMLGELEGVFIGIGHWFRDIGLMIGDLFEMMLGSFTDTWKRIQDIYAMSTTGKIPKDLEDKFKIAQTAATWLHDNRGEVLLFITKLVTNDEFRKEIGEDIKKIVTGAAKQLAKGAGGMIAKKEADFMGAPAFDQGEALGTIVGYIIPDILLAVFSEGIGNAIKTGLEAFRASKAALKTMQALKWVAELGRTVVEALGGFAKKIGSMANNAFKGIGKALEEVLAFFRRLMGIEKELPEVEELLSAGERRAKEFGYPKAEEGYHWVDKDGRPIYRKNKSNFGGQTREYDPVKKEFRDKPVKETKKPKKVYKKIDGYEKASLGSSKTKDYVKTFTKAFPETEGKVVVHHAIEQDILEKFPGLITESEMHSLQNLRGIPKELNPQLHLGDIRKIWNRFYKDFPVSTRQQLLDKATEIDNLFGHLFYPPIR